MLQKEQGVFEIDCFCNSVKVFLVHQFNASSNIFNGIFILPVICALFFLVASRLCGLLVRSILLIFYLHTVTVRLNEYTF